jgi:hypothetical protein
MAKFSEKVKGKEIGQANVYAEPHTMSGKGVEAKVPVKTGAAAMNDMNISVGGVSKGNYKPEKTDGIKIRGTGAATKGVMARGPMA